MLESPAWYVRLLRMLLGVLGLTAVGTQFGREVVLPEFSAVNFFSYFTILSNIAAGVLLMRLALAPSARRPALLEWVRGAMTVYMATTGLVFALLLDTGDLGLTLPWVNTVIHRVIPVVLFLDWIAVRPLARVAYGRAVAWLAVPVLYVTYSVVRGLLVGWYPYPFLQPDLVGGLAGVFLRLGGITVGIVLASLLVAWLGNARLSRSTTRVAA